MATIVLAGLMYTKCELYIDDLLVFAQTIPVFLDNLRSVFLALRMYNITLNPKKCRFGMSSVEYVGHVIDEHGITFTEEKRGTVLNFPLPQRHKEMLQFLGLINYFRDHMGHMTRNLYETWSTCKNIKRIKSWNETQAWRNESSLYAIK